MALYLYRGFSNDVITLKMYERKRKIVAMLDYETVASMAISANVKRHLECF